MTAEVVPTLETNAEQRHGAAVKAARDDPACFAQFVLKNEKTGKSIEIADHQIAWHDLMSQHSRLLLWSAIETGKSQHASVARVLWELGHNPNLRIVILSAVKAGAQKIARQLRHYIQNSAELHAVFPDLMPGSLWNEFSFNVRRTSYAKDPTVQVIGVHGKIYGARTDLLIVDDILDSENTRTPELRAETIRWVKAMPMSRLDAAGRMWVIGTAFHREDFLHHLAGMQSFTAYRYPVVVRKDDGTLESRWPEQWPMARIEQYRYDYGELEFARQLMCEARSDDDSRFKQEWIDWAKAAGEGKRVEYMLEYVPNGYRTFTGVDLGVEQHRKADPTALVTVVLHPDQRREILCVESGRWTGPQIIEKLGETKRRYQSTLVIESNAAQKFIVQFAAAAAIDAIALPTGRDKLHPELGIEGVAVELQRRQWIIPNIGGRADPEVEKLCGEMLWYDPSKHTGDRLIALWKAREGIRIGLRVKPRAEAGFLSLMAR